MKDEFNINEGIISSKIKLINEEGKFEGMFLKNDALSKARELCLDLVEMDVDKNGISVCKMVDYGKLRYSILKKKKLMKNSINNVTKEMKISYNISDHDLNIKNKKITTFINKKYKVNYVMELKGREKNIVNDAIKKMGNCICSFSEIATWSDLDVSYSYNRIRISTNISPK